MSGKHRQDYKRVFQVVQELITPGPDDTTALQEIVLDFEDGLWRGIGDVLAVPVKGCLFHWVQCLWKKVQELGLVPGYMRRTNTLTHMALHGLAVLPTQIHQGCVL